jgi:hypothetical protein
MSSPVVLNHRGTPEPSSEIQRRLTAVHPRLSLLYVDGLDEHWAICLRWDENDARWGKVQSQVIDPTRSIDIIGYLPMACSVDEAPAYLERAFRFFPREDVNGLVDRIMHFNSTAPAQAAMEQAIAEVLDSPDPSGTAKRRGRPPKAK